MVEFVKGMWEKFPAFLLALFLIYGQASGGVIHVGDGERIKNVKDAVEQAEPYDTIYIETGFYQEGNILLNKPVVILGKGLPTFDGDHKYEIFTVTASNVTIAGIKFQNTGVSSMEELAAVKIRDARNITIRDNEFQNTFFGIYLSNCSITVVRDNKLNAVAGGTHEMGNGIHAWKSNHITIEGNAVEGHRDGIYFEFVTASFITDNLCKRNRRYGLHFMFSHDNEYRRNAFTDNGAGVAVMYTKGVKMIDNTFSNNWGASSYGLLLKDIRDSEVSGNRFVRNSAGIFMEGSSRIQFRQNIFSENGYAVRLQASCDDNVFEYNNFTGNTFDLVTNGSLVLNTINGNYWDRYEGYDLDRDNVGDVPYRPVSMYSMIVERMPTAVLLWRSFLVFLLDRAERAIPAMTPVNLKDESPSMKPHDLS